MTDLVTPHGSTFYICGTCFGLYGGKGGNRQLCSCASEEEHERLRTVRNRKNGTYWPFEAVICKCCGSELLRASHKFAHWFCPECLGNAARVNRACGRCAIPIGWHSIVNGVFISTNRCKTLPGATAAADELNAFFRETASVHEWSEGIVERHWRDAGLPIGRNVLVDAYLSAVAALHIDKEALFDELRVARGVPPNWRELEAIPLELVWYEESAGGKSLIASEEILWWYPEDEGEDEEEGYDYAGLTLRVASAGDSWVWEVVLDEQKAGEDEPVLAHGTAPSLDEAKLTCETEALRLIDEQEKRSAEYDEIQPSIEDQYARACELLDASSAFDGGSANSQDPAQFGSVETTWRSHKSDQCYEVEGTIEWRRPGRAIDENSLLIRIASARLGMWLWTVSTTRERGEEQTLLLSSGVASTAKEAKSQSVQAAVRLFAKEWKRSIRCEKSDV